MSCRRPAPCGGFASWSGSCDLPRVVHSAPMCQARCSSPTWSSSPNEESSLARRFGQSCLAYEERSAAGYRRRLGARPRPSLGRLLHGRRKAACKPSSVAQASRRFTSRVAGTPSRRRLEGGDHLSSPGVATGIERLTLGRAGIPWSLYLALLRMGFAWLPISLSGR